MLISARGYSAHATLYNSPQNGMLVNMKAQCIMAIKAGCFIKHT
jgi:hypothetical protein